MSDDSNDFTYLTPAHFLIGDSISSVPEPNLANQPGQLTHSYRSMLQRVQRFWIHWNRDYLQSLQRRNKWCTREQNLKIGDVVLIKDERLPL